MKLYLSLIAAAALSLAACGEQAAQAPAPAPEQPAAEAPAPAEQPAAEAEAAAPAEQAAAPAEGCSAVIEANDAMQFNTKELTVSSACGKYTVTLKHVGKAPKTAMGHNVVIAKAADVAGVVADSAKAAPEFITVDDARVIAHTAMIGGGEETSVTFETAKLAKGEAYEFFCTFPGHYAMMKGTVKVVD